MLLGSFSCFGDSRGDVSAFGTTYTNAVLSVTNDYECAEAEATTTFYYACNAVDIKRALIELLFFWGFDWAARPSIL
jgi:hypothetical protein